MRLNILAGAEDDRLSRVPSLSTMHEMLPPTIDPHAAQRWQARAPARSPWLHEEVGRRMQERLQWIRLQPLAWADWEAVRGGLKAHALVASCYPRAKALLVEPEAHRRALAEQQFAMPWWKALGGTARSQVVAAAPDAAVQMLWANMALHLAANPRALIDQWYRALAVNGFLMFSCLGPDSLRELRALYDTLGWPPPAAEFTDMHDWGDMLVQAGFAEPVMDMERLTLTWTDAAALLAELRELGANVHRARFQSLRGKAWRKRLEGELTNALAGADGRLALSFEIVYGHAIRPAPRVGTEATLSLQDMKSMLRKSSTGA